LIRTLAEEPPELTIGGIFLIAAPFMGDGGWQSDEFEPLADLGGRLSEAVPIYLYHGSQDETAPLAHVDLYAQAIPLAIVRRLSGRDHQLNNDMSEVAADVRRLNEQSTK
jgi:pimeloyl-ACP methyl ester carboxylesterase